MAPDGTGIQAINARPEWDISVDKQSRIGSTVYSDCGVQRSCGECVAGVVAERYALYGKQVLAHEMSALDGILLGIRWRLAVSISVTPRKQETRGTNAIA